MIVALAAVAHASPIPSAPQDGVVPEVEAAQEAAQKWINTNDDAYDEDLKDAAKNEDQHGPILKDGDLAKITEDEALKDNGEVIKAEKKEEKKKADEEAEDKKSKQEYVHRTALIEACFSGDGCDKCMKKCPACEKANPAKKWPHVPFPPNEKCRKCAKGHLSAYDVRFDMDWKKDDCLKCTRCHALDEKPPKCFKECRAILSVCPECESSKKDFEGHFAIGTPHFDETQTKTGYQCSLCAKYAANEAIQESFRACKACYGLQ